MTLEITAHGDRNHAVAVGNDQHATATEAS